MAECQLPKLNTRVRFPSPAPAQKRPFGHEARLPAGLLSRTGRFFASKSNPLTLGFDLGDVRHVGASFLSLAPTFFKSQSALIPLLLLFQAANASLVCGLRTWSGVFFVNTIKKAGNLFRGSLQCVYLLYARPQTFLKKVLIFKKIYAKISNAFMRSDPHKEKEVNIQ